MVLHGVGSQGATIYYCISSSRVFFRVTNMETIYGETGCHPPCKYTEFSVPINPIDSSIKTNFTTLEIHFSRSTIIQKKVTSWSFYRDFYWYLFLGVVGLPSLIIHCWSRRDHGLVCRLFLSGSLGSAWETYCFSSALMKTLKMRTFDFFHTVILQRLQ